jgi:hypothetical protein
MREVVFCCYKLIRKDYIKHSYLISCETKNNVFKIEKFLYHVRIGKHEMFLFLKVPVSVFHFWPWKQNHLSVLVFSFDVVALAFSVEKIINIILLYKYFCFISGKGKCDYKLERLNQSGLENNWKIWLFCVQLSGFFGRNENR